MALMYGQRYVADVDRFFANRRGHIDHLYSLAIWEYLSWQVRS